MHRRGRADHGPAEEARVAALAELVLREEPDLLGRADSGTIRNAFPRRFELRVARRDEERRRRAEPGVDPLLVAPRADAGDASLGGADDLERPLVTDALAEDREVVP